MTVYKYPLKIDDEVTIQMPEGAEVLAVQTQTGQPYLWARVDPNVPTQARRFKVRGTGHPDATGRYIGTFQMHSGALVFHVFES